MFVLLYLQVFGVDHPADEEQRPRGFVPDQVDEGAVHSERYGAGCRGGAGVLVPLGRHLHDNLVFDTAELGSLSCDLLQVWILQPFRETCREGGIGTRKRTKKGRDRDNGVCILNV